VVRSLGFNPTQAQLRGILQEVRDPDVDTGYVQYDRFEKCMLRIVTEKQMEFLRDNEDKLLRAFKAFDPDDKGFIDPDYLKDVLTSRGDAFREEEVKELMSAAIDSKTGNIFYEDFAEVLAADGRVI